MTEFHHPQLPLRLHCKPNRNFESFVVGENHQLLRRLQQTSMEAGAHWLYLWGQRESGKSHLLQAACQHCEASGKNAFYLALREFRPFSKDVLEGLDGFALVAIDDIQEIMGNQDSEEAVFHLYNRLRDQGKTLLLSADGAPQHLSIHLADLRSRLSAMEVYQVRALADADKADLLRLWAHQRGFELGSEVVDFILHRAARSLSALQQIVEQLDEYSLQEKRVITVPFVKKVTGL